MPWVFIGMRARDGNCFGDQVMEFSGKAFAVERKPGQDAPAFTMPVLHRPA